MRYFKVSIEVKETEKIKNVYKEIQLGCVDAALKYLKSNKGVVDEDLLDNNTFQLGFLLLCYCKYIGHN